MSWAEFPFEDSGEFWLTALNGGDPVNAGLGYSVLQHRHIGISGDCTLAIVRKAPFIVFMSGAKWGRRTMAEALEMREKAMAFAAMTLAGKSIFIFPQRLLHSLIPRSRND